MNDTIRTEAPITISLSIAELAQHLVPGYNQEYDEVEPVPALDALLGAVAALIAKDIRKEVVAEAARSAKDSVHVMVERIVHETLDGAVSVTDEFGRSKPGRPLRDVIADEVAKWSRGSSGSSYNRELSPMQKFVKDEVDRAIKEELRAVLDEERQRFREAVRSIAAATLADDAAKRR